MHNNMSGPQTHCIEWNQVQMSIHCDSTYTNVKNKQK